jgi:hypothetical protein
MGGCISKMVGGVVPWYRDIPALLRAWFISQTGAGCLIHRRMLEIRPNLAAHHFERRCSGQFSPSHVPLSLPLIWARNKTSENLVYISKGANGARN